MIIRHALTLSAAALMAGAPAFAGPCEKQIYDADVAFGARLDAAAARGPGAAESTFATLHRQPTPGTVASAAAKAGDLPEADVRAAAEDMEAARKADAAGDLAGCQKALADLRRIIGP